MRAMILAAGRGQRMRPLTDETPKPLLKAGGWPLIDWHLAALARAGIVEVVINTAWLGGQIRDHVGDGSAWGVAVSYSNEGAEGLETGGGIHRALTLLGDSPFAVVNGDVWSDFDLARLPARPPGLAHLVLVDNPAHNPHGDFVLRGDGLVSAEGEGMGLTFAGIGCYEPALLRDAPEGAFRLAPLLQEAARQGEVTGVHHTGDWFDIGTPERLDQVDAYLRRGGAAP